eukprot:9143265-Ditylum_brightwellii.AAC.1
MNCTPNCLLYCYVPLLHTMDPNPNCKDLQQSTDALFNFMHLPTTFIKFQLTFSTFNTPSPCLQQKVMRQNLPQDIVLGV